MIQLMPLPLTVSCFSKIHIGFTFLVLAHPGSPEKGPLNGCVFNTTWVSRYQKAKTSLDLNEERDDGVWGWQWHQLDHMQTICTSLQTDNHANTSSLSFYRPDALPVAQPTVKDKLKLTVT